ncbi:glycosyltransferase family 4 protein [Halorussus caseinilyticus]|uniref:Glycosyltransferase family 4 protein n=1 Tax=Halorussus caseinilyticus TaxID=3034025 RepID=A0ABD5WLN4_9EURY|nr:glycosyltransferase family 4 protein [Halorussus sp. DT72]
MRVLSVTANVPGFYRRESDALSELGVERTTLEVPGDAETGRSVVDYLRFVPEVLAESTRDYDLVHANYGLTAPAALAQIRLPVVVSLWGSDLLGEFGWLSRACARRADEVVVMSEGMAAELDRETHVVPHGVNAEQFRPAPKAEARAAVGWTDDARHVLFPYDPGRAVKDFPRAGRVVKAARQRVGDPVELHPLGDVDHGEMPTYVNAADALLLTSEHEGLPNSVKEALCCNLPVVSTDVGDVRERLRGVSPSAVADDDEELAAALADVLTDPRRSNGRESVADLRVERVAARLAGVYERAVAADRAVGRGPAGGRDPDVSALDSPDGRPKTLD